ncbi:MAG: M1 family metallopeptidase [Pseudonocardiaceae bacterium]
MEQLRRLSTNLRPLHNDLHLRIDPDLTGFRGELRLLVRLDEPTGVIELHAQDLDVKRATSPAGPGAGEDLDIGQGESTLRLHRRGGWPAGEVQLDLDYRGHFTESLYGFYPSDYRRPDGTSGRMWLTHCSPVHARRILPCVDEPAAKAELKLQVTLPEAWACLANGAATEREGLPGGGVRVQFAPVQGLSPNTLFVAFGELVELGRRDVAGVPVAVHGPHGAAADVGHVLDVAEFALGYCRDYFGIDYPYPKLDIVGVPDFGRSGMENCAAVTVLDAVLSASAETSSPRELMWSIGTLCHEIAHMWFGNLVSVQWWNSLWLSEAFATFMEWTMTRAGFPDLPVWEVYGIARAEVLLMDSTPATRPVEIAARSVDDIYAMFDVITFDKGFAVVLMLEQLLGPQRFRTVVAELLQARRGATISSADLWDALDAVEPGAAGIARTWVERPGHPVVDLIRTPAGASLAQRGSSLAQETPPGHGWQVIASVRDAEAVDEPAVIVVDEQPVPLPGQASEAGWVLGNASGFGFYHVSYRGRFAAALAEVPWSLAGPSATFAVLEDLWTDVLALQLDPVRCWDLVAQMAVTNAESDESGLWRRVVRLFEDIGRLAGAQGHGDMNSTRAAALRTVVEARTGSGGAAPEPIRSALAMTGDREALAEASAYWRRQDRTAADADRLIAAMRVTGAWGDADDLHRLTELIRNSADPQEVRRAVVALPAALDPELFERFFEVGIRDVRAHDAPFFFRSALNNPRNYERAWDLMERHWDGILLRVGEPGVTRALEGVRTIPEPALAARIDEMLRAADGPGRSPVVQQHIAAMHTYAHVAEQSAGALDGLRQRRHSGS